MKHTGLRLRRFLAYSVCYWRDRVLQPGSSRMPLVINFPVTDNCNSRCVMCDVWKTPSRDEMDSAELRRVLGNRLFRKVRYVGISGGEPTLRADLLEIVTATVESLPSLTGLSITTHGFNLKRHERFLAPIQEVCRKSGVRFSLNVSIDGVGSVHETIRGIPNGFRRSLECLRMASRLGIPVQIQSTISKGNVHQLEGLSQLAEKESAGIIFRKATLIPRLDNASSIEETKLDAPSDSFFIDFIESDRCKNLTPSPDRRLWYRDLAYRLKHNAPRRAPCAYQNEGVLISAHGDLFHCSISTESMGNARKEDAWDLYFSKKSELIRQRLIRSTCPGCIHDQSGRWPPLLLLKEVLLRSAFGRWYRARRPRPGYYLRSRGGLLRGRFGPPAATFDQAGKPSINGAPKEAFLLGCYGGEHVGDAAILGGVCHRLAESFGIEVFHVLSVRKHRTLRWVGSVELQQEIRVHDYDLRKAGRLLPRMRLVAVAGGPLMELPGLIDKHLALAVLAARAGIPFLVEGVGWGPFRTPLAKRVAAGLLRQSSRVTVRSEADLAAVKALGLKASAGPDPAFDYLSLRAGAELRPRMPLPMKRLFESSRPIVSLNLRPLWEVYSSDGGNRKALAAITEELLESLVRLIGKRSGQLRFVFIPFNADQFGFSDLQLGLQIRDRLAKDADYAVIEHEPDIDDCLWMLQRSTALIAMRFHACIFGISAGLPVCGLDYTIGEKGKVAHLFSGTHHPGCCIPVDAVSFNQLDAFLDKALVRH